jgi:hypothetical protein
MNRKTLVGNLRVSRNAVAIILGSFWLLDGILQLQPVMFGKLFVQMVILPNVANQPRLIAWLINSTAKFLLTAPSFFNAMFALTQLSIGLAFMFRRFRKLAIVSSLCWTAGVWVFGEGLGGLLTGTASALTGAPGAVLIYGMLGIFCWPKAEKPASASGRFELDTSVIAQGDATAATLIWCALWLIQGALWLTPFNRGKKAIYFQLLTASSGQPSWYASFLKNAADVTKADGIEISIAMFFISMAVGLGLLFSRHPRKFLIIGAFVSLFYWITGEALGQIATGMGTDPNSGPLIALFCLSLYPKQIYANAEVFILRLTRYIKLRPRLVTASAVALIVLWPALMLQSGPRASLADLAGTNPSTTLGRVSPEMPIPIEPLSMSLMPGMSGYNPGSVAWHYTGPDIPKYESKILTAVTNLTDKGHAMQTPKCSSPPDAAQIAAAVKLVKTTNEAVARFRDINVAIKDGYFPITDPRYAVVHYINPKFMNSSDMLNPNAVQSLVYATVPSGQKVLVAAMYIAPFDKDGSMPGGCLTQWHKHTNLCMSLAFHVYDGFAPCPNGSVLMVTPFMLHVWQVPVPGGALALDPTDLQTVEAAQMYIDHANPYTEANGS